VITSMHVDALGVNGALELELTLELVRVRVNG